MKKRAKDGENTEVTESGVIEKVEKPASRKVGKVLNIIFEVFLYAFLAVALFMLVISIVSGRGDDGAVNLFGYEMRIVVSDSMTHNEYSEDFSEYEIGELPVRSMVFVQRMPEDEEEAQDWCASLKEGDVLTFRFMVNSTRQKTLTHRIIHIDTTENGYRITLQGDKQNETHTAGTQDIYTSPKDDPDQLHRNHIIGKVVGSSVVLGNIVYAIKQPVGTALIIIVPCAIIIIWQVIRIISVVGEDKKKKSAEKLEELKNRAEAEAQEREKQAKELEELKKQIAELQKGQSSKDGADGNEDL